MPPWVRRCHRLEHAALEHPVDREGGIGDLVEAGRLLIEPDDQCSARLGFALVYGLRQAAFLPRRIRSSGIAAGPDEERQGRDERADHGILRRGLLMRRSIMPWGEGVRTSVATPDITK